MIYKETEAKGSKNLSYIRFNEWKDDVILFFHGFTGSKAYFPDITNDELCVISFDRPGVGESSVEAYYSMENFLQDVCDVLKKHGVTSVKLIGHSAGCYDAYALCQKREKITISPDIPVYVWYGTEDTTVPITFIEYFKTAYPIKQTHLIDKVGHMLYLTNWEEIIKEIYM